MGTTVNLKSTFVSSRVVTTVNAGNARVGTFGYFSNDIQSLKEAITCGKTTLKVIYARLDFILSEQYERRFANETGVYSLFYYTDERLNNNRY